MEQCERCNSTIHIKRSDVVEERDYAIIKVGRLGQHYLCLRCRDELGSIVEFWIKYANKMSIGELFDRWARK